MSAGLYIVSAVMMRSKGGPRSVCSPPPSVALPTEVVCDAVFASVSAHDAIERGLSHVHCSGGTVQSSARACTVPLPCGSSAMLCAMLRLRTASTICGVSVATTSQPIEHSARLANVRYQPAREAIACMLVMNLWKLASTEGLGHTRRGRSRCRAR